MTPVRATSRMEKGRIMDWKVSSLSGVSDNSMVKEVGEMSSTLAPMISQMVMMSLRVLLLAFTFRIISSRPM